MDQMWKSLLVIFNLNTNCESMVNQSLGPEEYPARGVGQVTKEIIDFLDPTGFS